MIVKPRRSRRKHQKSITNPANGKVIPLTSPRPVTKAKTAPLQAALTAQPKRPRQAANRPTTTATANINRRRRGASQRPPRRSLPNTILYPLRLIILGVGIGTIIGTGLNIFNSSQNLKVTKEPAQSEVAPPAELPASTTALPLKNSLTGLTGKVQSMIAANESLKANLLFVDLDNGDYLDIGAAEPVPAASTIKIPVLVAFFEQVDAGTVELDDTLTMTADLIAKGSGSMQWKPVNSQYSALYTASEMSIHSDNTATNMIIQALGGKDELNAKFKRWGLKQTQINNPLPDMEGTNLTSAKDLAHLLVRVGEGEILSPESRDRLFRIMGDTSNNRLLPQSLGSAEDYIIHKTGDIGTIIGDAGIVDMANGKRYIASIFVKRPYNDPAGKTLLHNISREFYQYLKNPPVPIVAPVQAGATPPESE